MRNWIAAAAMMIAGLSCAGQKQGPAETLPSNTQTPASTPEPERIHAPALQPAPPPEPETPAAPSPSPSPGPKR